jgi:hypothetical protein
MGWPSGIVVTALFVRASIFVTDPLAPARDPYGLWVSGDRIGQVANRNFLGDRPCRSNHPPDEGRREPGRRAGIGHPDRISGHRKRLRRTVGVELHLADGAAAWGSEEHELSGRVVDDPDPRGRCRKRIGLVAVDRPDYSPTLRMMRKIREL